MFQEDCCLQCGKPVVEDGRIYCSQECQALDSSSSTASSAFPSPALSPFTLSTDLPPLDLKHALSPASSTAYLMWDDDDDDSPVVAAEHADETYTKASALRLSYARRPSTTNNRSTIPLLHAHSSSTARSLPAAGLLQPQRPYHHHTHSQSTASTTSSDSDGPKPTLSPAYSRRSHISPLTPASPLPPLSPPTTAQDTVTARKRNRASLPAYFSLLAVTSPPASPRSAHMERPAPTTPRLARPELDSTHAVAGGSPSSAPLFAVDSAPPRGRRREHGSSRRRSPSRSRSRGRVNDSEMRGRRRVEELDGWKEDRVFGYGNGRSGLRERERTRDGAWVGVGAVGGR
ncbi:hypothetical protein BV25DRAFT_1914277 [Artomyces pyxidatus]|uniref:Uncharacterized protein n=1 Tax=Artomyces pyxidatus TaxID=48021 RepID=A0ACB8T8H1_9AGAM|nr:hypothetical protein BV25DRAFT_1914277 [Artomyces pyxidatus]